MKAVVFDLDGVLIDSEPLWERVTRARLAAYGHEFSRVIHESHMGMRLADVMAVLLEGHGIDADPEAFGEELIDALLVEFERSLQPMAGAHDALELAKSCGLRAAMATSSPRRVAEHVVDRFEWRARLEAVCSGDDVANGKPDPEIFLLAAESLGVAPGDCVAIEDSSNGVRAAKAAGMYTIAVAAEPPSGADVALTALSALTKSHLLPA